MSPLRYLRAFGFAHRRAAEEWARERGLTFEQGFTLGYLVDHAGAIQREIAEINRTTAASVASVLRGLERRGLVERRNDGDDVRSKRVFATPAGASLIADFDAAMD